MKAEFHRGQVNGLMRRHHLGLLVAGWKHATRSICDQSGSVPLLSSGWLLDVLPSSCKTRRAP